MKSICTTTALLVSLFSTFSQGEEASRTTPPPARHVGSTYYPLGTKDHPVTANEYCAYLNSNNKSLGGYRDTANIFDDPTFMNVDFVTDSFGHSEIRRNDCITRHNEYHLRYSVIEGRGDYIIDGLPWTHLIDCGFTTGEGFYPFPITEFNAWRQNPTSQEICDYLNQKIGGNEAAALLIKNTYPQALVLFNSFDIITLEAQQAPQLVLQEKFNDERGHSLFDFSSEENNQSSLLIATPIASPISGMEYYRPLTIYSSISKDY